MKKRKDIRILTQKRPVRYANKRWEYSVTSFPVRVMSEAEGYAMVRRPGAMPFAVAIKELSPTT